MKIKQLLPVTYLLLNYKGRIDRKVYWIASLFMWSNFYVFYQTLDYFLGESATWIIYPLMLWGILAVSAKRFHDIGKSGNTILLTLVPIIGPLVVIYFLAFKKGDPKDNQYGSVPGSEIDYYKNDDGTTIPHLKSKEMIINDVTRLNPVIVSEVIRPESVEELIGFVKNSSGPISVGGGRFSMGGQTASPSSTHIDMRKLNQVLEYNPSEKRIKVQAGIRWCDIQHYIDKDDLSVKIMQTYANFTVGGALSVNCHGRYMGLGPVVLSVRSIDVVLADGNLVRASRTENSDIFAGMIGGYNSVGIITAVEFDLDDNVKVKQVSKKMKKNQYFQFFKYSIREDKKVIFHNADIYPPKYENIRSVSWEFTLDKPTVKSRFMPLQASYPIHRYFFWDFTESPFGKWRREYIVDPLLFLAKKVHWRNYEAGYDVLELEPSAREKSTYVLQEYFVPIEKFNVFSDRLCDILKRHQVNMVNISVRHAKADEETYLSWAPKECFAFVLYYKQKVNETDKLKVAVWTRELMNASIDAGGTYYLPYQTHASSEMFQRAYPKYKEIFALKEKLDPKFRFRNIFWDTYYKEKPNPEIPNSEFHRVFSDVKWSDALYRFLQVIFNLYPEEKFFQLIYDITKQFKTDKDIYLQIVDKLSSVKPFHADLTYALPALFKQKKELSSQILELLGNQTTINGYLEIGTTGRYVSTLKKKLKMNQKIYLINSVSPKYTPADILERGGIKKIGKFIPLNDYDPINESIPSESLDLVTCLIGLHHIKLDKLDSFIQSIHRVLRVGGKFILRDHDVKDLEMFRFVSLIHTVFNAGLKETWEFESAEFKKFRSIDEWVEILKKFHFEAGQARLLQKDDPSDNVLMIFTKVSK
ncbi:FAD-binding protein [Leptospira jelokensis]|uniref:FAD-binding protein n=1 Tax=Leptospira jelokensis TaxID=2484931 RepID=A0A4Z1A1X2_9LEPT|nr:FAD-binding protein [Leptospira jelokensis]TGL65108.1 FAD-binding protein [Leptospira jelokensis]